MVAAIGSTAFAGAGIAGSPTAGLEAQITRYQKQLADCVNCDSAKTAQGKENIQEISNKISAAKARIEEINVSRSVNQAPRTDNQVNATAQPDQTVTAQLNQARAVSDGLPQQSIGTVGTLINVLA